MMKNLQGNWKKKKSLFSLLMTKQAFLRNKYSTAGEVIDIFTFDNKLKIPELFWIYTCVHATEKNT